MSVSDVLGGVYERISGRFSVARRVCIYVRDLFWPMLESMSMEEQKKLDSRYERLKSEVESEDWSKDVGVALEEVHRLIDDDVRRSEKVEHRAYQLLLLFGALLPLTASGVLLNQWEEEVASAHAIYLIGALAFLYAVRSFLWALETVNVCGYVRLGHAEYLKCWRGSNPRKELVKELLLSNLQNQEAINNKVSCSMMAQMFMKRAIILVSLVVLFSLLSIYLPEDFSIYKFDFLAWWA